ncbi:unnamed protein product [Candida verbasci]|uniref:Maintenance of telomere capping protein 6 n=1 Tax=Candida verbasci TaxID=1227364 RepID=A0A9W4XH36_9ASCO|nr:unnamed protein product [Candida verbasci]
MMFVLLLLSVVYTFNLFPVTEQFSLNETLQSATRSQRDISRPIPIDQISAAGLSLTALFEDVGYSLEALKDLTDLLNAGVRILMMDLYWNEFSFKWQLCPSPFPTNMTYNINEINNFNWNGKVYNCQPSLTTENIMSIISNYLQQTNTNVEASFLHILLNLKSINYQNNQTDIRQIYTNPTTDAIGNSTLNDTVASINSYIFTPQVLDAYKIELDSTHEFRSFYNQSDLIMPSLQTVLLNEYKRLLVNVISNDLTTSPNSYNISQQDEDIIFFNNTLFTSIRSTWNQVSTECENLLNAYDSNGVDVSLFNNISLSTHFRYIIDNNENPFTYTNLQRYIRCGLSPIFNASEYKVNNSPHLNATEIFESFIPYAFWSWSPGQPLPPNNDTSSNHTFENNREDTNIAYKCGLLTDDGWKVGNCYQRYQIVCQNETSPHEWDIPKDVKKNYFDIDKDDDCPDGYKFSIPRSNVEMLSLINTIKSQNIEYPVWIDINDITVTDCFVTGGPYAQCPYQKTVTTKKFVRMIAPSSVVVVVLLILVVMEKTLRTNPIQSNRKRYWKKALNDYYKQNDYEGVPS